MKKIYLFSLIAVICGMLGGCSGNDPEWITSDYFAMDTYMTVKYYGTDRSLTDDINTIISNTEKKLSVTDEDSELYKLNQNKTASVSDETRQIVADALKYCAMTEGALDISVYPVVREWGFTTGDYHVPDEDRIGSLLENVGYGKIEINGGILTVPEGMMIDPGSVGKGYTADVICRYLKSRGISSALLDLGGNIQTVGTKPDGSEWKIAVASPDKQGYIGVLSTGEKAVVTSGGYERYFEEGGRRYIHIIDPKTGYPVDNGILSVTVIGDSGMYCDALSTALFVMGEEKAVEFYKSRSDFDMILLDADGSLIISGGVYEKFAVDDNGNYTVKVVNND